MVYIPFTRYNPIRADEKKIKARRMNEKPQLKKGEVKPVMASCFDFRTRATSFDLHNIGQGNKMSLLSKLFRSKSDGHMKIKKSLKTSPTPSPKCSPHASPGAPPRRRFVRVIKDDQAVGEEYVNPHVVRKVTSEYWEKTHMRKSQSLDEGTERPLPYTVTGHTILKKQSYSVDCEPPQDTSSACDNGKRTKFKDDVEVLEYDIKGKCLFIHADSCLSHTKLHDEAYDECYDPVFLNSRTSDAFDIFAVEAETKAMSLEVINETETKDLTHDVNGQSEETKNSTEDSPEPKTEKDITATTCTSEGSDKSTTVEEESSAPKKSKVEDEKDVKEETVREKDNKDTEVAS